MWECSFYYKYFNSSQLKLQVLIYRKEIIISRPSAAIFALYLHLYKNLSQLSKNIAV